MLKKTILGTLAGITTIMATGSLSAEVMTQPGSSATKTMDSSSNLSEKEEMLKLSEAFGHFIGRNLHTPGMNFDLESIIKGMREGVAGKPAPMSDQDYEALLGKVQEKAFKEMSATNLKNADAFIIENKSKPNVKEIEPGKLQFLVLQEGTGTVVAEHNAPLINYSGAYIDGTVFSSSKEAGGSITIPLDQTIPGFSKGILGMKEGEKRRLFVHPDLGYGTTGQLPPNSLLIFDIEVIQADNKDKAALQAADSDDDDSDES
jgi:peptidylprolyl isomerase